MAPPETATEITGPIPVIDAPVDVAGQPVTPQAPLDIRLREALVATLKASPRFSERPASFAESLEYSQSGDWATAESGVKRAVHGLATLLAFATTWPLDVVLKVRAKPIGFVLTAVLIFVLTRFL